MSTLNYKDKNNKIKQLSQLTISYVTREQIIDACYPVGSIYISVNPISPAITLQGGALGSLG